MPIWGALAGILGRFGLGAGIGGLMGWMGRAITGFGGSLLPLVASFLRSIPHMILSVMRKLRGLGAGALVLAAGRASRRLARIGALQELWRVFYAMYDLLIRGLRWALNNLPWGGLLAVASWIELCRAGLVNCVKPSTDTAPAAQFAYIEV